MLNPFRRLGKHQPSPTDFSSSVDFDTLVKALAARANQGASWEQILTYLRNRGLSPDQVAQWMTKYGGKWVIQPDPNFGQGLRRLGEVAGGELASIASTLGLAIAQDFPPPAQLVRPQPEAQPSPTPEPLDPAVLAEIEAYLRGDFSFADSPYDQP